ARRARGDVQPARNHRVRDRRRPGRHARPGCAGSRLQADGLDLHSGGRRADARVVHDLIVCAGVPDPRSRARRVDRLWWAADASATAFSAHAAKADAAMSVKQSPVDYVWLAPWTRRVVPCTRSADYGTSPALNELEVAGARFE